VHKNNSYNLLQRTQATYSGVLKSGRVMLLLRSATGMKFQKEIKVCGKNLVKWGSLFKLVC